MLTATVSMADSSCTNHSAQGDGACFYLESSSDFTANNVSFTENFAWGYGGAVFASSSTLAISGGTATGNKCLLVGGSGTGAGGVLYATTMYALTLSGVTWSFNQAETGGAVNLLSVKEGQYSVATGVDTRDDYYGARIFDSVFEGNTAVTGGAISAKQTLLWAKATRFSDNVATGGQASAVDMAFDAIYQLCTFETSAETVHNGTMVEVYRGVFDNCTVVANQGIAINVKLDTGKKDVSSRVKTKTYPILSRNTDLSAARVSTGFSNGRWDWMKCLDSAGARDKWFIGYDVPDLINYGVSFEPACPSTATCSDDYERRTLTCTCPAGSYHANIMNADMACTKDGATFAPTPMPQVKAGSTGYQLVASGPNRTFILADYNPVLLTLDNLLGALSSDEVDVYTPTLDWAYGLLGCGVMVLLLSLTIDVWPHKGASPDTKEAWLLWWMQHLPGYFHVILCVDRKVKRQWVEAFDPDADTNVDGSGKRKKKKKKKDGDKSGKREKTKREMNLLSAGSRGTRESREDAETKDHGSATLPSPGPEGRLASRKAAKQQSNRMVTL
jgi:predicted outer membrane repeat protein